MSRQPAFIPFYLAFLLIASYGNAAESGRPNIIFILADDLGYGDLSCYGQRYFDTPNLDRLAADGMRFTHCYAGSTVCAPSRACLMTGLHTGHSRVRGNSGRLARRPGDGIPLQATDLTVAEVAKQAGYRTGCVGKWGLGLADTPGAPNNQGFDFFYGFLNQAHAHHYYPEYIFRNGKREGLPENLDGRKGVYIPDKITDEGIAFIERNAETPFFLYLSLITPHAELLVPHDSLKEFEGRWPEEPFVRNGSGGDAESGFGVYDSQPTPRAAYAAMVTRMDAGIGRLLGKLAELGLDDRTLVVFSSDNGPHREGGGDPEFFNSTGGLRGVKRDLYEGGIRVPLLARWPGRIASGGVNHAPTAFWDFLPTVAELCGVAVPEGLDGVSLVAGLLGDDQPELASRFLYWEFHERRHCEQAARRGDWKAFRRRPDASVELYDLGADPTEAKDVAADHPGKASEMADYLDRARTPSKYWPLIKHRRHTYDAGTARPKAPNTAPAPGEQ